MKRTFWIIVVLSLILAACGGQVSGGTAILPLDEMTGGVEGPNVLENTGTSVVIQFTTGLPAMCNVAYGADADYGSLATMGMMGGAVREHAITLTGLTPNTTYHYRINLTDEQARLYQSQDLTFTTGGGDASAPGDRPEEENPSTALRVNVGSLAAGARVIGVSSNYGGGANDSAWGANNALDGQTNTAWSSNGDGDDAWIKIELAQTHDVSTIGFWTRTMSDGTAQIFRFTVVYLCVVDHYPQFSTGLNRKALFNTIETFSDTLQVFQAFDIVIKRFTPRSRP